MRALNEAVRKQDGSNLNQYMNLPAQVDIGKRYVEVA